MQVKVFNYNTLERVHTFEAHNTLERVHTFEAHSDYIRSIAVHPTQPYILTSSGKLHLYVTSVSYLAIS